jgi:hypothetical protein
MLQRLNPRLYSHDQHSALLVAHHRHPRFLLYGTSSLPPWVLDGQAALWMVELDVGWTGNLVDALISTTGGAASSPTAARASGTPPGNHSSVVLGAAAPLAASGSGSSGGAGSPGTPGAQRAQLSRERPRQYAADYAAFNVARADAGWRWFAARNWAPGPAGVWRSYRHAARYSVRLLRAVAEDLQAGRIQSDEATGATACAARPGWCVIDASWQPGHPAIGRDRRTGEALYRWELRVGPERWAAQVAADEAEARACAEQRQVLSTGSGAGVDGPGVVAAAQRSEPLKCLGGQLYHALKW